MALTEDVPPPKKIKRTSFPSWSSGKKAPKKDVTSPEPVRIVSDIVMQSMEAGGSSSRPALAENPKIQAVQRQWELNNQKKQQSEVASGHYSKTAGSTITEGSDAGAQERVGSSSSRVNSAQENKGAAPPVVKPATPSLVKKRLPDSASLASQPEAKRQSIGVSKVPKGSPSMVSHQQALQSAEARATARRFTEAAVMRQMNEINKRNPQAPPKTMRHFSSANELLQKIKNGGKTHKLLITDDNRRKDSEISKLDTNIREAAGEPPKNASTAPPKNDIPTPIATATDGRLYTQFRGHDGKLESGRGLITPAGYKYHSDPTHPYICPVRDCRRLFKGLQGLGGHFSAGHCSSKFNDNGDGTLTKVGSYTRNSSGSSPGIVVSRHPLPADAPPMASPSLPVMALSQAKRQASMNGSTDLLQQQNEIPGDTPSREVDTGTAPPLNPLRRYLHAYLDPAQTQYARPDILVMIDLPLLRYLPEAWIKYHQNSTIDIVVYACALAYLTGEEVSGRDACSSISTKPTSRLSVPCISLPEKLTAAGRQVFSTATTCVGCRYYYHIQRGSNKCVWNSDRQSEASPAGIADQGSSGSEGKDLDEPSEPKTAPLAKAGHNHTTKRSNQAQTELLGSKARDPSREPEGEYKGDHPNPQTASSPTSQLVSEHEARAVHEEDSALSGPQLVKSTSKERRALRRQARQERYRNAVKVGNALGGGFEMEDWEVAPGRIRDSDDSENIAYSNSYLTSGQPVTVSEDVSFNIQVIKPGCSTTWDIESEKIRTVSVASGKIKVTMGETTFQLGPNGMFVLRPGQTCKAENRVYVDATLHCTTMSGYALQ